MRWGWFTTPSGLTFLVVTTFVVVGGYSRLVALGGVSEWIDEAQSTLAAFSVLQHGYPVVVARQVIDNWEPLYPYIEAASILLLGHSNFAYRLPSAILGIALIPIAYWLGMRIRDRFVGITLAAMVAFSTEYIAWSRQARWYMLFVVLIVVGLLLAWTWSHASEGRRRRRYVIGLALVAAGLAVTSIGLFLLYVPAMLAGVLGFVLVARGDRLRAFFAGSDEPGASANPPEGRFIPYRYRLWVVLLGLFAVAAAVVYERSWLIGVGSGLFTQVLGFAPFPLSWDPDYGTYLLDFYAPIVALAFGSIYFIARRKDPFEVGLLGFAAGAFVSVSYLISLTTIRPPGQPVQPRHLLPLLFVLFLLSSITIVGVLRWLASRIGVKWPHRRWLDRAAPGICGVAVVAMLVLPSAVLPTGNYLNNYRAATPVNQELPWVPFSLAPEYPWALYRTPQADYQLAAEYALDHKAPGDVMATTQPFPVAVYYGSVQYYVRANAIAPFLYPLGGGQFEYYGSGAVWVYNTTQFESLLYNSSGWFVSDVPRTGTAGGALPAQMNVVPAYFMAYEPNGSDPSITLFHWNRSTPSGLLEALATQDPTLQNFSRNATFQELLGWAVTTGVRWFFYRDLVIPMTPYLLPLIASSGTRALGTLFYVYNTQPAVQEEFPGATNRSYNDTALLAWACGVASGQLPSGLHSILAPYKSTYCQ